MSSPRRCLTSFAPTRSGSRRWRRFWATCTTRRPSRTWMRFCDGTWVERVAGRGAGGDEQDSRLARAELEVSSDHASVSALEHSAAQAGQYPKAGWARRRAQTIAQEGALGLLSRKAVIPKYG